ncbi:hypothetical protein Pmani_038512 [Petrolisthes manimaculis]|uniref:Uncharacterized protein n=1 Tax=Petrolisthes manimaculis TaxID=1843537 RepID=A0AAE1NFJ4_9EUCA|nr:hypothetical protein Pmani_038512 [Petrolisthes manimaculis]
MDTKDTDIKQEPTAPGAEGNDGGFPQNNPAECDENTDWKKKYQELFPDVKTVTTSKKIRDVTKKALMMVDDEAGATEQTNQLSDFTRPLMDKVQILLKYINFEDLKQMKPYIKKKVEAEPTSTPCGLLPASE